MNKLYDIPSFQEYRLGFDPRPGYILTNASVTTYDDRIVALVHATDFWMDDRGVWLPYPPGTPESRCRFADNLIYLAWFTPEFEVEGLTEVTNDRLETQPPWPFRGFEGSRLFSWESGLWAGLATSGIIGCTGDEFYMGRIAPTEEGHTFVDLERLAHLGSGKNWMPDVQGRALLFHYWPGTTINPRSGERLDYMLGERVDRKARMSKTRKHGGSQVITFDGRGLAIVHDYDDVPNTFRRKTRQYFMRFDGAIPTQMAPFRLHPTAQLEITTGMAVHPDGKRLMISYGRDEADEGIPRQERAFIATINTEDIAKLEWDS